MSPEQHQDRAFFGRRKGHKLRPHQARLIETLLPRLAVDLSRPAAAGLGTLFPSPVDDIQLEIGFGGGEYLIAQAQERPRTGFIGVEPFVNGMAKALAAIESGNLQNIRLHFDDAVNLMAWLPQNALVSRLARILRPGGELRFVSEIADYSAWTLQRLLRSADFEWTAQCADDWRKAWPGFIQTRYHAKAAREERASCFLVFRKV